MFGSHQMLYFELESIVNSLLLRQINSGRGKLYDVLFDVKIRQQYLEAYDGVTGAHNSTDMTGSQLFWLLDHQRLTRKSLILLDRALKSTDGDTIELTPEIVAQGLQDRTLMPTLALSYSLLAFEYGSTLSGGFSQIDYLGAMAKSWAQVFPESLRQKTNIFAGELSIIELGKTNTAIPATICDLFLQTDTIQERLELINTVMCKRTLHDSIDLISSDLLRIVSPTASRK